MRTAILSLTIILFTRVAFAGDNPYLEAMQKNIQTVYTSHDLVALQAAANAFERIGSAEKNKWEPFYYESFGYVMMSIQATENKEKDNFLDQAEISVKKAKSIASEESEIVALEGFVQMMRMNVDPASRGQQYSGIVSTLLKKAIDLNGDNPRALSLMAQMQYGTAKFFNSSTADACAMVSKSIEKFGTFKSDNPLGPQWGKGMAEKLKGKCEQ